MESKKILLTTSIFIVPVVMLVLLLIRYVTFTPAIEELSRFPVQQIDFSPIINFIEHPNHEEQENMVQLVRLTESIYNQQQTVILEIKQHTIIALSEAKQEFLWLCVMLLIHLFILSAKIVHHPSSKSKQGSPDEVKGNPG